MPGRREPEEQPGERGQADRERQHGAVDTMAGTGKRFGGSAHVDRANRPHGADDPTPPPTSESARLPTSSWRSSRLRLAPIAVRTAISRCLAAARARSRFAMFAQAISSTNATADSRTSRPVSAEDSRTCRRT